MRSAAAESKGSQGRGAAAVEHPNQQRDDCVHTPRLSSIAKKRKIGGKRRSIRPWERPENTDQRDKRLGCQKRIKKNEMSEKDKKEEGKNSPDHLPYVPVCNQYAHAITIFAARGRNPLTAPIYSAHFHPP